MNEQDELEVLGSLWRTESAQVPVDLERVVRNETWRMSLNVAVEVMIAIVFLGGSFWLSMAQPEIEFLVLAVGVWMVTMYTLIWSWTNRAGTWAASARNTRGFLELSLRRCRRELAAIWYGFYLLGFEVVLLGTWQAWYWSGHSPAPTLDIWLLAAFVPVVFLFALLALRRRWRQKLERLEALERDLIG